MRTKIFQKKLVLNKKTIVHLDNDDLGNLKGGDTSVATLTCPERTCNTDILSQCAPCSLGCPPTYFC